MEKIRKRSEYETTEEFAGKRPRTPATYEETSSNDDEVMAWLSIDDETGADLSKLLEITEVSPPVKVKFIDNPYSSPSIFQASSSYYVTINGNEESCGSSFSDSDSSAMVSVDMRGISYLNTGREQSGVESFSEWFAEENGSAGVSDAVKASEKVAARDEGLITGNEMNGSDCCDFDDDMLARFLGEDISV